MKKKVVIDERPIYREFSNKVYREMDSLSDPNDERNVADLDSPKLIIDEALAQAIDGADWDENDPGVGKAVLLMDGRELLNPTPVAPPVSISSAEPSVNDLVERALRMHEERVAADAEANEVLEDLLDFDEEGSDDPVSPWEVSTLVDEVPDIPKEKPPASDPPAGGEDPPPAEKKPRKAAKKVTEDLDEEGGQ